MSRFGRLPGEFLGIDQDIQDFTLGDDAMVSRVEFVVRARGGAHAGSIGILQSPEVHIDQAKLEVGGLEYPASAPPFERDGFHVQAAQYYRRLIGIHGTQVRSGMSSAGVRMQHHYLSERIPFEVEAAEPAPAIEAADRAPSWDDRFGPRIHRDPRLSLIEMRWRIRAADGRVLQCAIYRAGDAIEVRAGYGGTLVRSHRCQDVDAARARAQEWSAATLAKPGYVKLA